MNAQEALRVLLSDTKAYDTSLYYAINYVRLGACMEEGSEELRVQCLYILNNIIYWRHPQAKEVRRALKQEAGLLKAQERRKDT